MLTIGAGLVLSAGLLRVAGGGALNVAGLAERLCGLFGAGLAVSAVTGLLPAVGLAVGRLTVGVVAGLLAVAGRWPALG